MEKLRTALGRFTSGLCNVDELRTVFRDYLRDHPEKRDIVARWLADSIRIGRVSPALMLTIGDLLAQPKPSVQRSVSKPPTSKGAQAAGPPVPTRNAPIGGPVQAPDATALRVDRTAAPATPSTGASESDRTIYPQPSASSQSLPPASSDREGRVFTPSARASAAGVSGIQSTAVEPAHPGAVGIEPERGESAEAAGLEASADESFEEHTFEADPSEDSTFDPVLSLPPSSFQGTYFPEQPQGLPASTRGRPPRRATRAEIPASRVRSIDPASSAEISVLELTNAKAAAEAVSADTGGAARVGDVLDNRYTLVMELGHGGMGSVFKALDRNREDFHARNPYIALKLLSEDFRRHPDAVMALQRETERAQSLAHENIVKVFDFDYDGPHAYMTMELLEGEPLDAWIKGPDFERASLERRWRIVEQIGDALVCAHKNGVVHSDLKPGNIFVCGSGTVKVMDFGIARPLREVGSEKDTTLFDPGKRLGGLTPAYASLEQWNQEAPDPRDDVYSFACVVYYMYAGKHPRGSITSKEDLEGSQPPRRIRSLTRLQWDTLRRALALHRRDRIASVQEFLDHFEPRTWFRRYRGALAASAAVAALGLLYFGVQYYQDYATDQSIDPWPPVDSPVKPLTADQRRDIDDYLYLGKAALQQATNTSSTDELSALLSSGDNNLLDLMKRVRELEPANEQASKLTGAAASLFEDRAEALLDANRPADALRLVIEGQSFKHTFRLFRLKRSLCRHNAELCRGPASYN